MKCSEVWLGEVCIGRSELSRTAVKWSESLFTGYLLLLEDIKIMMKSAACMAVSFITFFHILLVLCCVILYMVVCFVCFCLTLYKYLLCILIVMYVPFWLFCFILLLCVLLV